MQDEPERRPGVSYIVNLEGGRHRLGASLG